MKFALFSGILWGLDTVVLGMALVLLPFLGASEASIASALLHDVAATILLFIYMGVRGRLKDTWTAVKTKSGRAVMLGALLGGPIGMSGYLIAINNIGAGYTAIISTFYPAVGTFLAFAFLGERMKLRQIIALLVALGGVVVMSVASSGADVPGNALVGMFAALLAVFGWGSEAVILAWGMRDDAVDNEVALHIRETTSALAYIVVVAPIFGVLGFTIKSVITPATGVIVLAAIAGTLSYLAYYKAIGSIGASRSMALNISYSAWAVLFGLILVGTVPGPLQIICCVVILVGTVLAATADWRELGLKTAATENA